MFNKIALASAIALTGCTHTFVNSIDDLPADRTRPVQSHADSWHIFMFSTNAKAPEEAVAGLEQKCDSDAVKVSMVKTDYTFWFVDLLFKQRFAAQGYCQNKT